MDSGQLRKAILAQRDSLSAAEVRHYSAKIIQKLETSVTFQNTRLPLFFISFRSEVHTHDIIKNRLDAGLPVLVPRSIIRKRRLEIFRIRHWDRDLAEGAYGILEPLPDRAERINDPSCIDAVLVPGSVFDRKCGRYGYGGGFYDRFLQNDAPNAVRIGLAFHFQLMDEIPLQPHDQRLDIILTDHETVTCSRKADLP